MTTQEFVAQLRELWVGPGDGWLPVSFAQQRLWFLDQLEPGTSAYPVTGCRQMRESIPRPSATAPRHTLFVIEFAARVGELARGAGENREGIEL